jgi:hypothetical protein
MATSEFLPTQYLSRMTPAQLREYQLEQQRKAHQRYMQNLYATQPTELAPKPNLGLEFLRANPQALYQSTIAGLNSPLRNFFGSQYGTLYNEYLGDLAKESNMTGSLPKLQFSDFLSGINWANRYYGYSPRQRGSYPNTLTPATRFLNW